ncbi:hypothetical protein BKA65DRAFT_525548 [Rhexocercosporidium sp. MPI-PUGE-AT-0058]|nr:hypothetical protein BKA65DRAFT_525548 [Rhexocercosporidium sp. MPI-PUGE-AT-0058]
MPVTIKPAPHGANKINTTLASPSSNARDLLRSFVADSEIRNDNIIQSTFQNLTPESHIYPKHNGFVDSAVQAYNQHHHLTIRPDDIWLAILAQLNIYINAHAEELRSMFVDHAGQKELTIWELSDIKGTATFGVDWGKFSFKMSKMLAENIKDPSLREWMLPCFSTTTKVDQAVASIMMMASLQKYFSYGCGISCGLPSVTLLGEKSDWERLALKAERLPTFGKEAGVWYGLLQPVLKRFVMSFDEPDSEGTRDFWQKIAHYSGGGSGPKYLSGWITAFCFWGRDGNSFFQARVNPSEGDEMYTMMASTPILQLDDARYHRVDTEAVPPGWASVPVQLDDDGLITKCVMIAGLMGTKYSSSDELNEAGFDTISIESGWWMYETYTEEELKAAKAERDREIKRKYKEKYGFDSFAASED